LMLALLPSPPRPESFMPSPPPLEPSMPLVAAATASMIRVVATGVVAGNGPQEWLVQC
jgi:hypothetical protein